MDEIDARAARRREQFAHLALIAPTPEMIRKVMAPEAEAPSSRTDVIAVGPDPVAVRAGR